MEARNPNAETVGPRSQRPVRVGVCGSVIFLFSVARNPNAEEADPGRVYLPWKISLGVVLVGVFHLCWGF